MSKILVLNGDTDSYFATDIFKYYQTDELIELIDSTENDIYHFCDEYLELYGSISIKQFEHIDPNFLKFLYGNDYIDEEFTKHRDFILLEEK